MTTNGASALLCAVDGQLGAGYTSDLDYGGPYWAGLPLDTFVGFVVVFTGFTLPPFIAVESSVARCFGSVTPGNQNQS